MEENKASLLTSILLCFHPSFYPRVLRQNGWRSFLYLGLICLIVYGFLGYRLATFLFEDDEARLARLYEKALPDFYFENGEADYPPDKPNVYEEEADDKTFALIVDTSGKTEHVGEKYDVGLLITKSEIVTKNLAGEEIRENIPRTPEKIAVKEFFKREMRQQKPKAVASMTLQAYVIHLVAKAVLVAFVSGVLLLADKGKRDPYPFGYYFNVGCYAVTPFILSAFARGGWGGPVLVYTSYGVSLLLFLTLAITGLSRCRQEDVRELQEAQPSAG